MPPPDASPQPSTPPREAGRAPVAPTAATPPATGPTGTPSRPGAATPPAPAAAAPREYTGSAPTPAGSRLELSGIAYAPDGGVALVNGKPLARGEGLVTDRGEAFLVESIEPDRVTLVSAGVRLVLRLR
jgi:hypothetical protein